MIREPIAVVITCCNLGRYLEEALASVRSQTRPANEIVVVDDGSTDVYTAQVLGRLELQGQLLIRTANRGVSAARNTGIEATASPYVVSLDADDVLAPTYLEKAGAVLDSDRDCAFVACAIESFGANHEIWKPPDPALIDSLVKGVVHPSSMFRRAMWEAVGGFDETFRAHEELDFWTRVLEHGFKGHVLDEPLLRYRIRPGSMYQAALRRDRHLELMRRFYQKHEETVAANAEPLLVAKERFLQDQRAHQDALRTRAAAARADLARLQAEIDETVRELRALGRDRVELGDLRRLTPFSAFWGLERGLPLDRYYIESFLAGHRQDIRGQVLEIKDPGYTRMFGDDRVTAVDVLDIDASNDQATIVADLALADSLEAERYDCIILTQTLGEVYDVPRALASVRRALKPGGVLLCTVPAAGRITFESSGLDADFWRFTEASLRTLMSEVFPPEGFEITGYGNVLACASFLYGLAPHELTREELEAHDPYFPVVYGVRAVRPPTRVAPGPRSQADSAIVLMYHRVGTREHSPHGLCVTGDDLREHIREIRKRGGTIVSLKRLVEGLKADDRPRCAVALTFDDGYQDAVACASILAELHCPATVFVVSRALDERYAFWWDVLHDVFSRDTPATLHLTWPGGELRLDTSTAAARADATKQIAAVCHTMAVDARDDVIAQLRQWSGATGRSPSEVRPMTEDEVRQLADTPGIDIGAHGENHVLLPSQSSATQTSEVVGSKRRLETLLGRRVTLFAYPYGGHDDVTIQTVRQAGFDIAVTADEGPVTAGVDPLRVPRYNVGGLTADQFRARLAEILPVTSEPAVPPAPRVLLAGWFSFEEGHATAGDVLARDVAREWLDAAGYPYDIAAIPRLGPGVDWRTEDPDRYSHVIFVCGPFANSDGWEAALLQRFSRSRLIGLNLSMLLEQGAAHPFDVLFERDSDLAVRADLTFAAPAPAVPVVGLCLVEDYPWGDTASANRLLRGLIAEREMAVVPIDTRLDVNATGLRTAQEVEGLLARMDVVLTTRLHGMVLALRNGVPVIAIDPTAGGGKIARQGSLLGWPAVFVIDRVTPEELNRAFDYCGTSEARREARRCTARAIRQVERLRAEFTAALARE